MTVEHPGTGDELWDEFVREVEKGTGVHEPSAAERAGESTGAPQPGRRSWRRWLVVGGATLGVVALVGAVGLLTGTSHSPKAGSSSAKPTAGTSASPTTKAAVTAPMVTQDQAFPARVAGFTKVKQSGGPNCTGSGMVGPGLATMIEQSKGCRGVIGALYKDAQKNEYSVVLFGMKDPGDVAHLITVLGMNPTDYEVGMLQPPAGSGLVALPADSGLVQAFEGTGGLVAVGLAQWSDGRAVDFQTLENKLQPLLTAVTKQAAAHDGG